MNRLNWKIGSMYIFKSDSFNIRLNKLNAEDKFVNLIDCLHN